MFTLPMEKLKEQIKEEAGISIEEVDKKIKAKMDELSGLVSEEGAAHIIANELGIKLADGKMTHKVENLKAGMKNVEVAGKVLRKYELRTFESMRGPGKVASFVIGDETGTIRVVLWNDQAETIEKFDEGDIIKISSSYVRNNNGRTELHLNSRSDLEINPDDVEIGEVKDIQKRPKAERKEIKELTEEDDNVEILVTIVDVFDPRFFTVCPECNRRVDQREGVWQCDDHGEVKPRTSYVLNVIGDDGTDTMRIVLWQKQSEHLLSKSQDEILKFKDYPEQFEDVKHKLLGEIVRFVGRTTKNQMFDRLEFSAQLVFTDPDPNEELEKVEAKTETE